MPFWFQITLIPSARCCWQLGQYIYPSLVLPLSICLAFCHYLSFCGISIFVSMSLFLWLCPIFLSPLPFFPPCLSPSLLHFLILSLSVYLSISLLWTFFPCTCVCVCGASVSLYSLYIHESVFLISVNVIWGHLPSHRLSLNLLDWIEGELEVICRFLFISIQITFFSMLF